MRRILRALEPSLLILCRYLPKINLKPLERNLQNASNPTKPTAFKNMKEKKYMYAVMSRDRNGYLKYPNGKIRYFQEFKDAEKFLTIDNRVWSWVDDRWVE